MTRPVRRKKPMINFLLGAMVGAFVVAAGIILLIMIEGR